MSYTNHVLIDTLPLKNSLLPMESQPTPNSLAESLSINRVVHSWLPSLLLKQFVLYPVQVLPVTHKCSAFAHLDAFSLAIFLSGMYQSCQTIPVPLIPSLQLNASFKPTLKWFLLCEVFLTQLEEISLICSDGILWLSVLIHHSLPFIMVVHLNFCYIVEFLRLEKMPYSFLYLPMIQVKYLTDSRSRKICCIQPNWKTWTPLRIQWSELNVLVFLLNRILTLFLLSL